MTDQLRFHPQVPHDLADAIGWYDEISTDLANRLRDAIRDAFAKIINRIGASYSRGGVGAFVGTRAQSTTTHFDARPLDTLVELLIS